MVLYILLLIGVFLTGCAPSQNVVIHENTVIISVHLHDVDEVGFASSLDQFQMHQARQGKHGQWFVSNLPNREFAYFFVADGNVLLPECRHTVQDDFGSMNCRYLPAMN